MLSGLRFPRRSRGQEALLNASACPTAIVTGWFEQAYRTGRRYEDDTMVLATCGPGARPSARVVVCQGIELDPFALLFFTTRQTRKAQELAANPSAAAVFFWARQQRQARVEGEVLALNDHENDARFCASGLADRWRARLLTAEPRGNFLARSLASANAGTRPPGWAGYLLVADAIELWAARGGIRGTRVRWVRSTNPAVPWVVTYPMPS